jgi:hypothetical protein
MLVRRRRAQPVAQQRVDARQARLPVKVLLAQRHVRGALSRQRVRVVPVQRQHGGRVVLGKGAHERQHARQRRLHVADERVKRQRLVLPVGAGVALRQQGLLQRGDLGGGGGGGQGEGCREGEGGRCV